MAFLNRQEVTFSMPGGTSTLLVGVAAFTLANLALVSFSWRASATASNNWDSQVTVEPLPGSNQFRVRREGNTGTITGRIVFVEDDRASAQHVKTTALGAGANALAIASSPSASTYINPLGMSCQGARDDQVNTRLTQTSDTNVNAQMTVAPPSHELNLLAIEFAGCTVQQATQASNSNVGVAISAVVPENTFTFCTETVSSTSTWRDDEIDTYDLDGTTTVRLRRFFNGGANSNQRAVQAISMPSYVTVQRGNTILSSGGSSQAFAVSSVDEARSVAKGCGAPDGNANHAGSGGTNANQERCTFETEQTSPTQVTQRRDVTTNDARLSFELITFGEDTPPATAGRRGTPRRWRNGISRRAMVG